MPGQRSDDTLRLRRAWAWTPEAEWRWRRALCLLLDAGVAERAPARGEEDDHGDDGSGLCPGLDRTAGGDPDH
ncbi:MAG: hypothetical protein M3Q65_25120 [Chloroflexota bacterium]|nr:hypothetical protein [Chloroflexota bacterium]